MITLTGYAEQHPSPRLVISGHDLQVIIYALYRTEEANGYTADHLTQEVKRVREIIQAQAIPQMGVEDGQSTDQ